MRYVKSSGLFFGLLACLLYEFACGGGSCRAADFSLTDGRPADVGMLDEPLAAGVAAFRVAGERGELRGSVVLVARRGRIGLHGATGRGDLRA